MLSPFGTIPTAPRGVLAPDAPAAAYLDLFGIDPDKVDANAVWAPANLKPAKVTRRRPIDRHDDPGYTPQQVAELAA